MSENKDNRKNQGSNRNAHKAGVAIGSSSSSIAALLIQRNVEKGKQISIPSVDTKKDNSSKNEKSG